jgi:D-sedoheptulose 7-phosphate isomerase
MIDPLNDGVHRVNDFAALLNQVASSLRSIATTPYVDAVARATALLTTAIRSDKKILIFGNGGSAADSQHIAAELVGRFNRDRYALPAIALGVNHAYLTAWSNDTGYEDVFARELEALGARGDVAWGISTSGNSGNVVRALERARALGLRTLGLTGNGGGTAAQHCDVLIDVPLEDTSRVQEVHLVTYHAICAALEASIR